MISRTLWALALAGACGAASFGAAAETLSLQDAINRALGTHPSLQAAAAVLEATQQRAARESLATPFTLSGDLENVAGSGNLSGLDAAEATFRVSKLLELGGKRATRTQLGGAQVQATRYTADVTRIEVASRAAGRHIDVLSAQERLEHANERIHAATRIKEEVTRWVNAARNPDSDLRAAEIAVLDAELIRDQASQALAAARMSLAASWGQLHPDFDAVSGDLAHLPELEDFNALSARVDATPLQRQLDAQRVVLEARRDVALASSKPDLNVSLGFRRLEATKDNGLVMSVSVPLGAKRRSGYSVAEADAELTALQATREAGLLEIRRALFENHQQLAQARLEAMVVRDQMLPKAEQALRQSQRGFAEGRFSFLVLAQAQRMVFELREREVEAAATYLRLLVESDRMTASILDVRP